MAQFDPMVEAQVWQRVMAKPNGERLSEDLKPLILSARELAAAYRQLAKTSSGRQRELLRKLHEREMANIACLKGIHMLSGGGAVKTNPLPAPNESAAKLLEKCYYRSCRALTEYTARSAGGEFGEVYRHMADRQREQCALVAELLGSLQ